MKAKHKILIYNIVLVILLVFLFGCGYGIIAYSKKKNTGVNVVYTSKNVNATISASYSIDGKTNALKYKGSSQMLFTGEETDKVSAKTFDSISDISLKKNSVLLFNYTIKNNSADKKISLESHVYIMPNSNLIYKYSTDGINWYKINPSNKVDNVFLVDTIDANATKQIYIQIFVENQFKQVDASSGFVFVMNSI